MIRAFLLSVIAVLLAFGLVGCRDYEGEVLPSDVVELPSDVVEPVPDLPAAPEAPGLVFLPGGPLPDTGFVPIVAPERYFDGPVFELIPSPDYGRIWPFIGGFADGMMGTQSELIGICDANGKIICDPVFNEVALIEHDGHRLFAFIKYERRLTGNYYEELYLTTLTDIYGSWAETFEQVFWRERTSLELSPPLENFYGFSRSYHWRDAVMLEYITARRDGRWGVLDWDGSVLLPFEYAEPVFFHEGLASVLSEDENTLSFIDITGRVVLGPFQAPPRAMDEWDHTGADIPLTEKIMFYEGYAKFYEDGKFGIIDRGGRVVIPAEHDFITGMSGGIAMFVNYPPGGEPGSPIELFGVVNDLGVVIVDSLDNNSYWSPSNMDGYAVLSLIGGSEAERVAHDGTRTPLEAFAQFPFEHGDVGFVLRSGVSFPYERYSIEPITDELLIVFDFLTSTWRLHDYDGNPVSQENPGRQRIGYWGEADYILINASPPDRWVWPPPVRIFGLDGSQLLDGVYYSIIPVEDKFMVRGSTTAGLADSDGEYIIRVSIKAFNVD